MKYVLHDTTGDTYSVKKGVYDAFMKYREDTPGKIIEITTKNGKVCLPFCQIKKIEMFDIGRKTEPDWMKDFNN